MDFYEAVVETQVLALKALLNVSTYPKNQVRIAKAGLFTLLGINSFFSSMLKDAPHDAPEHDVLVLSSRILQNVALHPQNRTMLYQAELRGSLRKVELLAEPKLAAKGYIPAWGDEGARTVSETISKRSSSPKRSMASTGKSAAARTGKSTTLEAQTAVPENLRAVLPRDMPKGKVAQDGIKLDDIQRPKVLFPPIEPRSSRGEGTASTIKAEGPGTGGPGTWKRKDLPTKDRFADWAVHTFSAGDTEEGTFAFRDSSDSEDEEVSACGRAKQPSLVTSLATSASPALFYPSSRPRLSSAPLSRPSQLARLPFPLPLLHLPQLPWICSASRGLSWRSG